MEVSSGRPGDEGSSPTSSPRPAQRFSETLRAVDHAAAWVEWPVRRLSGSARLNPLPHAGSISVFLLGVVVVTGLYITLFFEFGHDASYQAVASLEEHPIQRAARALHRYASAVLVVTTLVHAWRIFVAGRFVGRLRRWRWATGLAALVLVWSAGVTGYWLIWDVRAQALNEIVIGLVGDRPAGVGLAVDHLGVIDRGSGSGFLLALWFVHLGLTGVIGWFLYRHLRRSKLPWLPPPHWMALMGFPLLVVSVALPVGMLAPAEPGATVDRIPVDPFVLFLLPPLLSTWRWVVIAVVTVGVIGVGLLPRLLRRRDPAVVEILDEACTGCELCVADCPYDALAMVERPVGPDRHRSAGGEDAGASSVGRGLVAVVEAQRCVGCGVCLGSCAFGAIELEGQPLSPSLDVAGRAVVVACDRHLDRLEPVLGQPATPDPLESDPGAPRPAVHAVRCAGALAPGALRAFAERGAADVQVVGCAPNDCRYGIGNTLAAERLAGSRRPHPPHRYARRVAQDWVASDRVAGALAHPGEHPALDTRQPPSRRESLVGVGLIAVATALGVALATQAPFGRTSQEMALRLVVDHRSGAPLSVDPDGPPRAAFDGLVVRLSPAAGGDAAATDRTVTEIDAPDGDRWAAVVDLAPIPRSPDAVRVEVAARVGGATDTLVDEVVEPVAGRRLVIDLTDRPPAPGVDDGRAIFAGRRGGCSVCHSVEPGDDGVGPTLHGIASAAGNRVDGLDAEGYLRQSILLPDQYVVDGWPAGQMLEIYRDRLSPDELDAVIAYLLTLEDPEAGQGPGQDPGPAEPGPEGNDG